MVFSEMGVSKQVRGGAMLLLAGTAGVSYYMVAASSDRLITHFVVELGQNLYFVGVLLTYLLWGAMVKLRENRTRLMQIVLSMGVYLSLFGGQPTRWEISIRPFWCGDIFIRSSTCGCRCPGPTRF